MGITTDRRIAEREVAVIRAALRVAPVLREDRAPQFEVEGLRVVGRCDCGCASVDFVPREDTATSTPVAHGVGTTIAGGTVGVIVWGKDVVLTALEIYDLGAGQDDLTLPDPDSVRPTGSGAA
jgi:hypothetical protein